MLSCGIRVCKMLKQMPTYESAMTNKEKPSKLLLLRADFQQKLLEEKEAKLMRIMDKGRQKQEQTISRYNLAENQVSHQNRNDTLSAPGGVRNFFQERKKMFGKSNSATQIVVQNKKREGYDKSHRLLPINHTFSHNNQQTINGNNNQHNQEEEKLSEFQKWQIEQNKNDFQRQMKAKNNSNISMKMRLEEYYTEKAELETLRAEEEKERQMIAAAKQEEQREKQAIIKRKQEEKRRSQLEIEKNIRDEVVNNKKESSDRVKHQRVPENSQKGNADGDKAIADEIERLERELAAKQRDLIQIKSRKYTSSMTPETTEHEGIILKPKKVTRNHASKTTPAPTETNIIESQPSASIPVKSKAIHNTHELNKTYKVTRESSNSPPIISKLTQNFGNNLKLPDDDAEPIDLVPCLNCGRSFASDRLDKHQIACKKITKPRKQFNITEKRIAGSGAEEFINKKPKQSTNRKAPRKDWRAQHKEFIETIRYAKMASNIEAHGGKLSDLPPPPKAENPDYVECPHCNRRFNETAAERHIPKCKDIRAKPQVLRKGGGVRR